MHDGPGFVSQYNARQGRGASHAGHTCAHCRRSIVNTLTSGVAYRVATLVIAFCKDCWSRLRWSLHLVLEAAEKTSATALRSATDRVLEHLRTLDREAV